MSPTKSNHCLVVLTDSLYLPGTRKTIESWFRFNPPCPVVMMSKEADIFEDPFISKIATHTFRIDPTKLEVIQPYKKRHSQRHSETFAKFFAFSNFGYNRNIFLDSDILCLKKTPLLTNGSDTSMLAALDTGFRKTRAYKGHPKEINTGVLSIPSSIQGEQTISDLIQIAVSNPGRGGYNSGDQGIINKWIHQNQIPLELLSQDYNLIKKDYHDTDEIDSCRLLHFCDRKPWFPEKKEKSESPTPPLISLWKNA